MHVGISYLDYVFKWKSVNDVQCQFFNTRIIGIRPLGYKQLNVAYAAR